MWQPRVLTNFLIARLRFRRHRNFHNTLPIRLVPSRMSVSLALPKLMRISWSGLRRIAGNSSSFAIHIWQIPFRMKRNALKFQRPADGFADLFYNGGVKFSPSIRQLMVFRRADGLHIGEGL